MNIFTSSFKNISKRRNGESSNGVTISICSDAPRWYKGLKYSPLIPNQWIVDEYRRTKNSNIYEIEYKRIVLNYLDPAKVLEDLYKLSNGKDIALLGNEKSGKPCHTNIVAKWISDFIKAKGFSSIKDYYNFLYGD